MIVVDRSVLPNTKFNSQSTDTAGCDQEFTCTYDRLCRCVSDALSNSCLVNEVQGIKLPIDLYEYKYCT